MKLFDYCMNRETFDQTIQVQARGMPSIQRIYPNRAHMIRRGHNLALSYATEALLNLDRFFFESHLDNKRRLFVEQFFDTSPVSAFTLKKVKVLTHLLLGALLDPSLNPENSARYVMGSATHPEHGIQAFIMLNEPTKNIYLTESFFDPGFNMYLPLRSQAFDMLGHNMASVLLHEISHLTLDTLDLAYLNSSHPFLDLLETVTAAGKHRHQALEHIQKHALSSTTPVNELFKILDDYDLQWHNLSGPSLQRVLQMTGTQDLDEARRVFFSDENKRVDVILSNADSLALLIANLGRPIDFHPVY